MGRMLKQKGFTIVELLIVVVVIAILAAITVVAFSGIQQRARTSSVQSEVASGYKKLETVKINSGTDSYPSSLSGLGFDASSNTVQYHHDSTYNTYCLESTRGTTTYSVTSSDSSVKEGACTINSLVGWWTLNGNAQDSIGTNTGTISSATLATGQGGAANTAYSFVTGSITFPQNYSSLTSITKSAWVYLDANPNAYATIFDTGTPPNSFYIETRAATQPGVMFGARVVSGGNAFAGAINEFGTAAMTIGAWHHVAQVVSKSDMKVYIDGVLAATVPGNYNFAALANTSTIGGGRAPLNGRIDDVRIYSRVLSAGEVAELYADGAQ